MVNKTGLLSVVLGLLILGGCYLFIFQQSLWWLFYGAVSGGLALLGAFLVFIGLLMLLL